MVTTHTGGWLRRKETGSPGGEPRRSRPRPRRWVPELTRLEGRELQTVVVLKNQVFVHPGVLPPNGRFVPVAILGQVISTRPQTPTGFFHVTDEYRRLEPFGTFPLVPSGRLGPNYTFSFRLTLNLQARRSTNTSDGRHYYVLVGGSDSTRTGSQTVQVLVPKTFPLPATHFGKPAVAGPATRTARAGR